MRRYENVPINELKPYKNNARTHNDKQIEKIAKDIDPTYCCVIEFDINYVK